MKEALSQTTSHEAEQAESFEDLWADLGVDMAKRNETLGSLREYYGGRIFHYGFYSGTVDDMMACPAFGEVLEQGFDAAVMWLETHDEPKQDEDDESKDKEEQEKPAEEVTETDEVPEAVQTDEVVTAQQAVVVAKEAAPEVVVREKASPKSAVEETVKGESKAEVPLVDAPDAELTDDTPLPASSHETVRPIDTEETVIEANSAPTVEPVILMPDEVFRVPRTIITEQPVALIDEPQPEPETEQLVPHETAMEVTTLTEQEPEFGISEPLPERQMEVIPPAFSVDISEGFIKVDAVDPTHEEAPVDGDKEIAVVEQPISPEVIELTAWEPMENVDEPTRFDGTDNGGVVMETIDAENDYFVDDVSTLSLQRSLELMATEDVEPIEFTAGTVERLVGEAPLASIETVEPEVVAAHAQQIVDAIETLRHATTAEECEDAVADIRTNLVALLRAEGYDDAERLASELLERYRTDIKTLDELMNELLEQVHHTAAQKAAATHHPIGRHAVALLVDMIHALPLRVAA